jgi:hypothetical protein
MDKDVPTAILIGRLKNLIVFNGRQISDAKVRLCSAKAKKSSIVFGKFSANGNTK